jgi:hypothetical protein
LGSDERLHSDKHDHHDDGKSEKAEGKADSQLVEADACAQQDRADAARSREPVETALLVTIAAQQYADPKGDQNTGRDVISGAADRPSQRRSEREADEWHRGLERRDQGRDAKSPRWRHVSGTQGRRNGEGVEAERQDERGELCGHRLSVGAS